MTVVDELPSGTKVFYVDIEGIPSKDVETYIDRVKKNLNKKDPFTDDFFVPHRGEITVTAHLGNGEGLVIDLSKLNDKQIKRINDILKEGE